MGLNEYLIKNRIRWLQRTIKKDIQKNEIKARKKLIRSIIPLLDIFDIEDELPDGQGQKTPRTVTPADLQNYTTEKLANLLQDILQELEQKV